MFDAEVDLTAFEQKLCMHILDYNYNQYVWSGDLCLKLKKKISYVSTRMRGLVRKGVLVEHHRVPDYFKFTPFGRELAKDHVFRLADLK
jgi:hypothetical protein